MPDVDLPYVFITTQYPGAAPEAVEADVTKPIEYAVNQVSGVKRIFSNSARRPQRRLRRIPADDERRPGDPGRARQDRADPPDISHATSRIRRSSASNNENSQPVVSLAVMSQTTGLRELTSLTDQTIVKALENLPGVARIDVNGRVTRQILVQIKPNALTALGIGVDQVINAIRAANQDVPAGRITRGPSDAIVRVEGKIKDPVQFGRIIVAQQGGGPVYLDAGRRRDRRREGAGVDLAHQRPPGDHARHPEGAGREHRRDRAQRARRRGSAEGAASRGRRRARHVFARGPGREAA